MQPQGGGGRAPRRPMLALALVLQLLALTPLVPAVARSLDFLKLQDGGAPMLTIDLPAPAFVGALGEEDAVDYEIRLLAVLSDGGRTSSAQPMASWDAAVHRVFFKEEDRSVGVASALCLVSVGRNESWCTQAPPAEAGPVTEPHVTTGDFDGDGKPDVVVGFLGGFTIYYLQDDPDQPIASYITVHAPTDVALSGGFVAFQNMSAPFTQWPCDIATVKDIDGDGIDELWTGARHVLHAWDKWRMDGAYFLKMQAEPTQPVRAVGRIAAVPGETDEMGSTAIDVGDVDGDGVHDVMAVVRVGEGDTPNFEIVYLSPDAGQQFCKRRSAVGLDADSTYWLRTKPLIGGEERRIGFGLSTVPDIQFRIPEEKTGLRSVLLFNVGDLTGDNGGGAPQILVSNVVQADADGKDFRQYGLLLAPIMLDYSQTRLVTAFNDPTRDNRAPLDTWGFQTAASGAPAAPTAAGAKAPAALLATPESTYAFLSPVISLYAPLQVLQLPRPLEPAAFARGTYDEPVLLSFNTQGYTADQALNVLLALLGLVSALLVMCRVQMVRKAEGTLASLLSYTMFWLFAANALYCASYLIYVILDMAHMQNDNLVHSYGLNEWGVSTDSNELAAWMGKMRHLTFWLQMISMIPVIWHLALAYLLHQFLVRGRSPAALEKQLRTAGWKVMLALFAAVVAVEAGVFYGTLSAASDIPKVCVHLTISLVCFVPILVFYGRTLHAWQRRYAGPVERHHHGHESSKHRRHRRSLWRLVVLLLLFMLTWSVVIMTDVWTIARGGAGGGIGDVPSTWMTIADAVILGNVLACFRRCGRWWTTSSTHTGGTGGHHSHHTHAPSAGGREATKTRRLRRSSMQSVSRRSSAGVLLRPHSRSDRSLRIFASSYNLGAAGRDVAALGSLEAWIPLGFDLYVIGLQECAAALLEDLKRAVHARVGGAGEYALYQNNVWSTNGEIALLVLARARDVCAGAFEILGGLFNRVNLGVSLGAWRLPNKAAVGLACRLYDRTLALVTAHFAADKHGKERPEARVQDAVRSLKELSLGHESEEVDIQLAFHHTFVLGDLNFRIVKLSPPKVVEKLAASVKQEKKALARLAAAFASPASSSCALMGTSTSTANSSSSSSSSSGSTIPGLARAGSNSGGSGAAASFSHSHSQSSTHSTSNSSSYWTRSGSGRSSRGMGGGSGHLTTSWRLARYAEAIQDLPAPGAFGTHASGHFGGSGGSDGGGGGGSGTATPVLLGRGGSFGPISEEGEDEEKGAAASESEAAAEAATFPDAPVDIEAPAPSLPSPPEAPAPLESRPSEKHAHFAAAPVILDAPPVPEPPARGDAEGGEMKEAAAEEDLDLAFLRAEAAALEGVEDEEEDEEEDGGEGRGGFDEESGGSSGDGSSGTSSGTSGGEGWDGAAGVGGEPRWWRWVREHDELSRIMREGRALHGFVEGPLCFPPSYRWVRGARIDFSKDGVGAFEGCYTLHKDGGKGKASLRPPSYTDRVLVHSLPDLAADVAIEEYDVCEAMVGSDHRPVAASIRLTTSEPQARLYTATALAASAVPDHRVTITLRELVYTPQQQPAGAVPLAEQLRERLFGSRAPVKSPLEGLCEAVVVHYPLAMEQPQALVERRKAREMAEGLAAAEEEDEDEDDEEKGRGAVGSAVPPAVGLGYGASSSRLPSGEGGVHRLRMRDAAAATAAAGGAGPGLGPVALPYTVTSSVCGLPLYALLRLKARRGGAAGAGGAARPQGVGVGGEGEEVGQGVLCLREVLLQQHHYQELEAAGMGNVDALAARTVPVTVEICQGGKLVGVLEARVHVSVRRLRGGASLARLSAGGSGGGSGSGSVVR